MTDLHINVDPDALGAGTRLGEFEIERVLGVGGFGIVYLAFDHALQRRVALKEYMPSALAARRDGLLIGVRSRAHAETFGVGLRSFVNEARLLARFDHPALVKVHRFWEGNGTAYMAMSYCEGQTLGSARAAMAAPPSQAWLLALTDAMLGALASLHSENVYHRDVAPDNIMLQAGGTPVLLDFGAARHVIGGHRAALTAIVKPNFAPIEQYADAGAVRQGPWSDLYSLGAVLHFCLIGRAPMPATLRVINDELPSLRALQRELVAADGTRYDDHFLGAIDSALAVLPEGRPQDAAAFAALLRGRQALPLVPRIAALSVMKGDARAVERAIFAPTTELARPDPEGHAVTTAWRTLGSVPQQRRAPWPVWRMTFGLAVIAGAALAAHAVSNRKPPPLAQPTVAQQAAPTITSASASASSAPRRVVARPVASAAVPATATPRAARSAGQTARASCGDRNFFSMQFCLDRQCREPAFARDPECVERLRQQTDRAERRASR
jgi:serine/threonine protein kinase